MICSVFVGLYSLLFVFLSVYTISGRRKYQISIGHNDNLNMLRQMRAHANFIEYTPLFLLMLYLAEVERLNHISIYILGNLFLVGRLSHAYAILRTEKNPTSISKKINFRVIGMALTLTCISLLSIYLIIKFLIS